MRRVGSLFDLPRRNLLIGASVSAAVALGSPSVGAVPVEEPERRVSLLVGFPHGSVPDVAARTFMTFLARRMPEIEFGWRNLPGDAGRTMLVALGDARPNGGTIGWVVTPVLPARIIDHDDPSLSQRIQLIGQVEREPVAFVTALGDRLKSIADMIRRTGNDGLVLGTPPAGSSPHLAALRLEMLMSVRLNIVVFPSAAAVRQAVLAGNVAAAVLGLSTVIDDVRKGGLTAVGIAARRRFALLPNTPVLTEAGIPLVAFIRRGFAVPAGTPPELIGPLVDAIRAVAQDATLRRVAEANGCHVSWIDGPAWRAQMQTEEAELARLWGTGSWLSSPGG